MIAIRSTHPGSSPAQNDLAEIGKSLKVARLRRRISAADAAGRSGVSLPTYRKIETGDPSVSLGVFVSALRELGLLGNVRAALEPESDRGAATFEIDRLPQRVSRRRS